MLNAELLSDLKKHKNDLRAIGVKPGTATNVLLDRFLRDFCDDSQRLTSTNNDSKRHTNFESARLLAQRLNEIS